MKKHSITTRSIFLALLFALGTYQPARAADHGDAPTLAHDQGADIADLYFFRDPSETASDPNAHVVLIGTFHGFIVPGEASNFGIFDPALRYRFEIYNNHVNLPLPASDDKAGQTKFLRKAVPNKFIDVTFNQRTAVDGPILGTGSNAIDNSILQVPVAQTATIKFTGFAGIDKTIKFTAPATNPSLSGSSVPAVTTVLSPVPSNSSIKVDFFAGERDDPFFFDIPGLSRFIGSIRTTGSADFTQLDRGRDTFAGYNVLSIALRLPASLLVSGSSAPKVGVDFLTQRRTVEMPTKSGEIKGLGAFKTVDRLGNPAVNVVLIPFDTKNLYNTGKPMDDIKGKFVGDIAATLTALGTDSIHIGALASVAVAYGDLLILDTSKGNNGGDAKGGGDPTTANGFPNGRRLRDDVVDILLTLITNGNPSVSLTAGDNVDANDVTLSDTFPFLAPAQQPRDPNVNPLTNADDNTRN